MEVVSSKTHPFLLQKLHREKQGQAVAVHRSSKRIRCEKQRCTEMKAMQGGCEVAHIPWRKEKVPAVSATITCLGSLAIEPERKEQYLHSDFPSFFLQMANSWVFRLLFCLPLLHQANICRTLSASVWPVLSCVLLRARSSLQPLLLCSLCFSICTVCWEDVAVALLTSLQGWNLTGLT